MIPSSPDGSVSFVIVQPHDKHVLELAEIAMTTGKAIEFEYDGKNRLVEVHAAGLSSTGKPVIRGYQIGGSSWTADDLPVWRLFTVQKIFDFPALVDIKAGAPRPGYRLGDKGMSTIFFEFPQPSEE